MVTSLSQSQTERVRAAVRALIQRRGTKGRAAEAICLHEGTLDKLLAGQFAPDPQVLRRIAQASGTTVEALMHGEPQQDAPQQDEPLQDESLEGEPLHGG